MNNDDIYKAYFEITEIFKFIPKEDLLKVPEDLREVFEKFKDNTHHFVVDSTKSFENQNVLNTTKAILANIYRDFWASEEKRNIILEKEKLDRSNMESSLNRIKNEDLFKTSSNTEKENIELTIVNNKKKNILDKIISRIKLIFKSN